MRAAPQPLAIDREGAGMKRIVRSALQLTVGILFIGACVWAQTAAHQAKTTGVRASHRATQKPVNAKLDAAIHAMFGLRAFGQAEISPDGKSVAWVESIAGPGGAPSPNSAIYVAELSAPEKARRITASAEKRDREEHDIAWSPDSKRLAFLSDAATPGQLQAFVADATGSGAAKQLTHWKGFLANPGWSPDGKSIALLFTENAPRAAGPLQAETPDEGEVKVDSYEERLAIVDPATAKVRQISPADMYVYEFDWSPDSKQLAITAAHGNGDDNWYVAGLFAIDAATGEMHNVVAKPGMQIAGPKWSPDGNSIAFIGGLMSDEPIPGGDIYVAPASGVEAKDWTAGMKMTANSLTWAEDSRGITFAGVANGQTVIARAGANGEVSQVWTGEEFLSTNPFVPDISFARDGNTSAVVRQSFTEPPEVWAGETGNWKQVTKRNAGLHPAWGKSVSLQWTTDAGTAQGWLTYPLDFDPAKKYPLIVRVHGGPSWAVIPQWPTRWAFHMALPSQRYFVLQPNPRGSYGQGEKFTRANVKDFGYGDFRDIMAGVDAAIQAAPIDPERMGMTGWSYGGYMSMWGVTQTNRFKAAVAGAGLSDWLSYYGENKIDQWMIPFFGASVYDDPMIYSRSAPMTFIKNAKTPTLVLVGDSDGECPPPQSYEFWHALVTLGVPAKFVIYPHEGHEFADPKHSRDVIERAAAWFNRYLAAAD
jgi:dipeptidyl aminopeptidase/acylaminoacyl peptidase